ncbi:MAG TPA: 2-hydroxyacid dehydrogenase, partial [Burkholderiales bacterium]|nr:2-hydroxyacid dehydrogenase [Burkholderiales bacterium]
MKPELLVLLPIFAPTLAALEQQYTVHKLWTAPDKDALIKAVAPRVRGVVTTGLRGCDAVVMDALPKLEIIASFGSPRYSLDVAAARARGIVCTRTPDTITESVADLALGLMIDVMRRITVSDRFIRTGRWEKELARPGNDVHGKRCGIVGYGAIGQGVAKRVQAFDMPVCYCGPNKKESPHQYYGDLVAMARKVDVLVVCCPLTPQTRGLVDAKVLDALGADGFLVNVARGPVVDEQALISALQEKRIAGAGLDVFWDEPRVPAALIAMENVVLAPHIGTSTQEVRIERGRKVLANL